MKMEIFPSGIKIKLPSSYDMICPGCGKHYIANREGKNSLTYQVWFDVDRCQCRVPLKLSAI